MNGALAQDKMQKCISIILCMRKFNMDMKKLKQKYVSLTGKRLVVSYPHIPTTSISQNNGHYSPKDLPILPKSPLIVSNKNDFLHVCCCLLYSTS